MIDFDKMDGLVPAIIQDSETAVVLMLGFMNREAYEKTVREGRVTFFSRTKKRLWTKGEESGNFLDVVEIKEDCDRDTLLVLARPHGPVCHTGNDTCFNEINQSGTNFLTELQDLIHERRQRMPEGSYTTRLFDKGIPKIAQKVGEEAVELVIEAMREEDTLFLNEAADLVYHLLVLLSAKGFDLNDIVTVLKERHK